VRLLPARTILARLDHRLALLKHGPRDVPARHQSLRSAISWSYDLLSSTEQAVFRRLAVFRSGCTIEAAESVLGPAEGAPCTATSHPLSVSIAQDWAIRSDSAPEQLDVLETLVSLVDKSLLEWREHTNGEPRFSLLETIREFALEHLVA